MSFLRNDEIKKQIIIYIIIDAIAFLGALFINITCSLYVVLVCLTVEVESLYFTKKRYNDISELTYKIDKILTEKEQFELTKEINKLLSRIEWLITALLQVAQLESGIVELKKENISISKVINKALEPLKIQAELKNATIDLKIEESSNYKGDYYWQVEAISNILKNCIEHSENGGTIQIISKENPIYTEIVIKDNGNGICEEDLPHLFERFYKGRNRSNESIGIGLYLTKMIITKQNGVVTVKNRESKGAEFNIKFYNET